MRRQDSALDPLSEVRRLLQGQPAAEQASDLADSSEPSNLSAQLRQVDTCSFLDLVREVVELGMTLDYYAGLGA